MFALSAGSVYPYPLRYAFELAHNVGFDGLEILANRYRSAYSAGYLNRLRDEYGVPILSIHSPFNGYISGCPVDEIERVKHSIALAEAVGARVTVIHPPLRLVRVGTTEMLADILLHFPFGGQKRYARWLTRELKSFQDNTPVTIVLENLPDMRWGDVRLNPYRFNNLDQLKRFDHVAFDTTHVGTWGIDLLEAYECLKKRIAHVHLSNYNGREHSLITEGRLPLERFLKRLKRDRYPGIVTLEMSSRALGVGNKKKIARNIRASLSFCRAAFT